MTLAQKKTKTVGLGADKADIKIYIENRPPLEEYFQLNRLIPLTNGKIDQIIQATGNHWRKIFNCYAKLLFELGNSNYSSWQELRDNELLQLHSNQQLLFSPPGFDSSSSLRIICGKSYFASLRLTQTVEWIDQQFAFNRKSKLIVCPYFDYRQLSNQKITILADLMKRLVNEGKIETQK